MKTPLAILTLTLVAALGSGLASAQNPYAGIFGSGVILTGSGAGATNNGTETLYYLDQSDNGDVAPTGYTGNTSTAFTSTGAAPTFNLGTFTTNDSLILNGASILTFQGNGDVINGATFNYEVYNEATGPYSPTFPSINLPYDTSGEGGVASNQRYATTALTTNLLSGLGAGTYELNIYNTASYADGSTTGTVGDTNNGNNYGATFTVVAAPEPSTYCLLFAGVGLLIWAQRRFVKNSQI